MGGDRPAWRRCMNSRSTADIELITTFQYSSEALRFGYDPFIISEVIRA